MSDAPRVGGWVERRAARRRVNRRRWGGRRMRLAVEQCEPRIALALTPSLVADVNLQPKSANPGLAAGLAANSVTLTTQSDPVVQIFTADDGRHGTELWVTDGTSGGTQLLTDIWPGAQSSSPTDLFEAEGLVYFAASDTSHGRELWVTDGTAAGTRLVRDIALPSSARQSDAETTSAPAGFARPADGSVLFAASWNDPASHTPVRQLWKTDGTEAGTQPVIPDNTSVALDPTLLTTFGTHVLFRANGPSGQPVLWITDGTAANTVLVQSTLFEQTAPIVDPRNFTVFEGTGIVTPFIVFTADDGAGGQAIWRYDSTNGPSLVAPFGVTAGAGTITEMVRFGLLAVFVGDSGDGTGPQLWRTSGGAGDVTPLGVYSSPNIRPVRNPAHLTVADKTLFFTADGLPGETSLWTSNGTSFGTFRLGSSLSGVDGLVARGGDVFFVNDDGQSRELWKSDGLTLGIVREINPLGDAFPAGPIDAVSFGDGILVAADDGVNGRELWKSDGTAAGTAMLKAINPENGDGIDAYSGYGSYLSAASVGNAFYFAANDGEHGTELWKRDGDAAPVLVADLEPGAVGSLPAQLTPVGRQLFFTTSTVNVDQQKQYALWVLDTGSASGPVRLATNVSSNTTKTELFASAWLVPFGDKLLFTADDGVNGREPWITDGTTGNTRVLLDINAVPGAGSFPFDYAVIGSKAVFVADDGVNGRELWVTDGTTTALLKDVFPGGGYGAPSALAAVGASVYFAANDGITGYEPWVTDGTANGTKLIKNINTRTGSPGANSFVFPTGSNPVGFTALGSSAVFSADDGVHGTELWITDGTDPGTVLLKDINPTASPDGYGGVGGSYPFRLTAVGGKVFFTVEDGPTRGSLWVTDGTPEGTRVVPLGGLVDPQPDVRNLLAVGGRLFFTADRQGQRVLLETDGTSVGSSVIELGGEYPAGFTGFNAVALAGNARRFYFGVDDGIRGKELWQIDFPQPPEVGVVAVGIDGRSTSWNREFSYTVVNATTIRIPGLTAIQSGFFSPQVPLTITPRGGLANVAVRVDTGRYDARSRSVLVTLSTAIPATPTTGTLIVGQTVQPGARLIDAVTGEVVCGIAGDELVAAGYSAAFATRFQGGLRVASADVDGNGRGDLVIAPGGVPDQADPNQPGKKLAAIFGTSTSRVAIFDGAPSPVWQPVSIDVGSVFGTEGAGGFLVALGDVRVDTAGSGIRELVVAAGRKLAVFDVLVEAPGARPTINPVPVQVMTLGKGQSITSVTVGAMLPGGYEQIVVASTTAKGAVAGTTTVWLIDGGTGGVLRSFAASSRVESGPSRNLVDIFGFGAQVAVGDFDGNGTIDLALGAGANGLGNFRVIGGEHVVSALWSTQKAGYQTAITGQLGEGGAFSMVRPQIGTRWRPRVGPDFFSPLAPIEPLGGGFNALVSVAAVSGGDGKARLFAALGANNQTTNTVRRFVFSGTVDRWVGDGSFDMRPQSPGRPEIRTGVGLRLG